MTEQEWRTCIDPERILELIKHRASDRKLRMFTCACCRRIWDLLTDERSRKVVEIVELVVDGLADETLLSQARIESLAAKQSRASYAASLTAQSHAFIVVEVSRNTAAASGEVLSESKEQSLLLDDIFGNPFRPVIADPAWLTPTVHSIAVAIYQERAFDRLPILADALEEAGCTNADILLHCRQPGEHVRGCWVVDLVLGKV